MILTVDNVEHVYVGAKGACCCGCSGNHIYHSKGTRLDQNGYEVSEGEIDDEVFENTIDVINNSPDREENEGLVDGFISVETGDELLIAYLREK